MKKIIFGFVLSIFTIEQAYSQTSKSVNAKSMKQIEQTDHYSR